MKKICVYTCITGDYDNVHEIENKEKGIDYLLFTNNKNIKSITWKIIYIENEGLDNQRLSRKIKMLGHKIIDDNYDVSVWMDASVIFKKSIKLFVKTYLKKNSFAAFKHYCRNCIYKESEECIRLNKDTKENIYRNIDFLKKEGYPADNGLYEMTVFIKKHNDEKVRETMELWFFMVCNYSKRDQLSFMYCIWKTGLKIDDIPLSVWDNDWFTWKKHNYSKNIDICSIYYGSTENGYSSIYDYKYEYKIKNNKYSISGKIPNDTNVIEIKLVSIPCVIVNNININLNYDTLTYYNNVVYNSNIVFYAKEGILKLEGDFKKGTKFKLSCNLNLMDDSEKYDFISFLGVEASMKESFETAKYELDRILNSKSWKLIQKIRKIKPGK